ncbi:MAG: 7-cyano-7-deazaguanine synthase QueC [candidate division Zixibacteria bacterium]|nr:7-cyano-7-deazaguanine synthase QueC [candidate division Zixibacteria bacterium]
MSNPLDAARGRPLAVVLISGGMDSVVALAMSLKEGFEPAGLHLNYGQKTEKREERAFQQICDFYGIRRRMVVPLPYFKQIGGSSLTDEKIPVTTSGIDPTVIPSSYVPFRNAHALSIATSWAEVLGASRIVIGAVEEDSSGYPDCREIFYKAFEKAIYLGTKPESKIEIAVPVIHFSKAEIVRKGSELGVPFHLTWSCYQNEDVACGVCDSCRLRLKGFAQAGIEDPIPYKEKEIYA